MSKLFKLDLLLLLLSIGLAIYIYFSPSGSKATIFVLPAVANDVSHIRLLLYVSAGELFPLIIHRSIYSILRSHLFPQTILSF